MTFGHWIGPKNYASKPDTVIAGPKKKLIWGCIQIFGTPDATIWAPNCVSVDTPYKPTTVLPSFQWSLLRSNSGFPVVTGTKEGEHRKSFTVVSCVLYRSVKHSFFGFMLVVYQWKPLRTGFPTCFHKEYVQSSHPST